MKDLTGIQQDAVTELLNIAIGRAADALNEMVEEEISLSVPFIDFVSAIEAAERLQGECPNDSVAVKQRFEGPFYGDALIIFPERKSLDLVRTILEDAVPLDIMTELEQDALVEVGNVILNACLGSLSQQLSHSIRSSLPIYVRGSGRKILEVSENELIGNTDDLVMFLHVDFVLKRRDIDGYVAFIMDITSSQSFRDLIDDYVNKVCS